VNWSIDVTDAANYMIAHDCNATAEMIFRGEDAFGNERTFSCMMYFGLIQMPETKTVVIDERDVPVIE
jgi:hypothetical protein